MSWAKGDDLYDDKPKIKKAWRLSGYAVGLHWMAVTASCRHENDGLVDPEWLAERLGVIPRKEGEKAVKVLVDLGLFDELPAGETRDFEDRRGFAVTIGPLDEDAHIIHDYLDYNDSSACLQSRRREDAKRKSAGGSRGVRKDSARIPDGVQAESGSPDPTRPSPNGEEDARASKKAPKAVDPDALPEGFPDHLKPALSSVMVILERVASAKSANAVSRAAVARAMASYPLRPHLKAAEGMEHWLLYGTGQSRRVKDVVGTFRNQLDNHADVASSRPVARDSFQLAERINQRPVA